MNKNGTGQGARLEQRVESIKDSVRTFVDRGEQKVDEIKHRVMEVKDHAVTRGNDFVARASELIRANPLKSIGIAFGLGFVGMRLFRR